MFRKSLSVLVLAAALSGFGTQAFAAGSGTGKGGDVPVTPGFHDGDEYTINVGGTSKGGEVPVTPGFQAGDEYTTNSTGTSKGGDTPVVTG